MKKRITLIFLLTTILVFSQKQVSGEIRYKVSKNFSPPKTKYQGYEKELKSIRNSTDKLVYTLKFNNRIALFKLEKSMGLDIDKIHRKAFSGKGKSSFYTNLNDSNCLEIKKLSGETFIIKNPKPKFQLSSETKIINGYKCYKATATETVYFSKLNIGMEDTINEIVAWYSTEIPHQFGPLNFFGLPGLILELQFASSTYTAYAIKLYDEPIVIKKPTKGKEMTPIEYEKLMIETVKKMKIGF